MLDKVNPKKYRGNVVCVMLANNKTIIGVNSFTHTSPRWVRRLPDRTTTCTRHAEIHALQQAQKAGGKIRKVYVFRWTKKGHLRMARPCKMCYKALSESGIRDSDIFYSNWDGEIVRISEE